MERFELSFIATVVSYVAVFLLVLRTVSTVIRSVSGVQYKLRGELIVAVLAIIAFVTYRITDPLGAAKWMGFLAASFYFGDWAHRLEDRRRSRRRPEHEVTVSSLGRHRPD